MIPIPLYMHFSIDFYKREKSHGFIYIQYTTEVSENHSSVSDNTKNEQFFAVESSTEEKTSDDGKTKSKYNPSDSVEPYK